MSDKPGSGISYPGSPIIGSYLWIGMILLLVQCTSSPEKPDFAIFYIDASEAENRKNLQLWLKGEVEKRAEWEKSWLAYFSNHDEPVVAHDARSLAKVRQALVTQFPPIPKPVEEADHLWQHVSAESESWEEKDLTLHTFLSPSFHDISKSPFFDRLLENFGKHAHRITLLIYTESAVPASKQARHSALRSVSYIQLTNDHLL